jgi:hypothetical protein
MVCANADARVPRGVRNPLIEIILAGAKVHWQAVDKVA